MSESGAFTVLHPAASRLRGFFTGYPSSHAPVFHNFPFSARRHLTRSTLISQHSPFASDVLSRSRSPFTDFVTPMLNIAPGKKLIGYIAIASKHNEAANLCGLHHCEAQQPDANSPMSLAISLGFPSIRG